MLIRVEMARVYANATCFLTIWSAVAGMAVSWRRQPESDHSKFAFEVVGQVDTPYRP